MLVNILVTCTKRKVFPPAPGLCIRSVEATDPHLAFRTWFDRLINGPGQRVKSEALYAGDLWTTVRSLPGVAETAGLAARIWVCSAGYGLVSLESELKSYSATFSGSHPDSVTQWRNGQSSMESMQLWWRLLSGWRGPSPGSARSIAEVASEYPNAALLVVASETYIQAIGEDLQQASQNLRDPDLLCVISAGGKVRGVLNRHVIPCDARMSHTVGGALSTLNARVARKILSESREYPIRVTVLGKRYMDLLAGQPPLQRHMRQHITDEEVKQFILDALRSRPAISRSSLLRRLRDGGLACEQSRFSSLYASLIRGKT